MDREAKTPIALASHYSAALADLHAQCFASPWHAQGFKDIFASDAFGYMIYAEMPLAFILLRNAAMESEILTLATHPAYQRQGLARRLLDHSCAELAAQNIEEIFLEVREDNHAAQALYESRGFTQIALRPNYYPIHDGWMAARVLRKQIRRLHAPL